MGRRAVRFGGGRRAGDDGGHLGGGPAIGVFDDDVGGGRR